MRASPRERFRVIAEDEFFGGCGLEWTGTPSRVPRDDRWTRRVAGAAVLVGAVGTVGGVIAVNLSLPASDARRRHAVRSPAPATQPASRVVARGMLAGAAPRVGSRRPTRPLAGRTDTRPRIRKSSPDLIAVRRREIHVSAHNARPLGDRVRAAGSVHEITPRKVVATASVSASTRQAEFGFEH